MPDTFLHVVRTVRLCLYRLPVQHGSVRPRFLVWHPYGASCCRLYLFHRGFHVFSRIPLLFLDVAVHRSECLSSYRQGLVCYLWLESALQLRHKTLTSLAARKKGQRLSGSRKPGIQAVVPLSLSGSDWAIQALFCLSGLQSFSAPVYRSRR